MSDLSRLCGGGRRTLISFIAILPYEESTLGFFWKSFEHLNVFLSEKVVYSTVTGAFLKCYSFNCLVAFDSTDKKK